MEDFKKATGQESVTVTTSESIIPHGVLLIVNTASKCGFTDQYAGLQELYEKYKDNGLRVVAYPSNTFKNQEPGTDEEIAEFCKTNYGVAFSVMPKGDVIGDNADPMYKKLHEVTGFAPKWNFHKYIVTPTQVFSFDHFTDPSDLDKVIHGLVNK